MSNQVSGPPSCPRCGHARPPESAQPSTGLGSSLRRRLGRGQERRMCGELLDLGWKCRCRSRFHGDFGLPGVPAVERPESGSAYDAAARARLAQQSLRGLGAERRAHRDENDEPGVG